MGPLAVRGAGEGPLAGRLRPAGRGRRGGAGGEVGRHHKPMPGQADDDC